MSEYFQNYEESHDLYLKARELMEVNQLEDAIELFKRSAELYPHFKTLEKLGECYLLANQLLKAVIPLAAATSLNRQVRAPSILAVVFLKLEEYDKARDMAEVALSRDNTNKKALEVMKNTADFDAGRR